MKRLLIYLTLFAAAFTIAIQAQAESLTLDKCREYAVNNYPLIKQKGLIDKSKEYNISNVWKGYYPQITFSGQAAYQSDVTQIPISLPGLKINEPSKDQYKIIADVTQTLYDGGIMSTQSDVYATGALIDFHKNEIELHKVKEQVTQIYFGLLLINEQLVQVKLMKKDIEASLSKLSGALQYGTATQANVNLLKAESLKSDQKEIELIASKKAYIDMMSLLINKNISESTNFEKPAQVQISDAVQISRAELDLFKTQEQLLNDQKGLTTSKILPKANLFFQGGYGRPGLNMLKDEFSFFYTTGVRFSWPISNLYTYSNEKELLEVNKNSVGLQKETFLLNTNISLKQQLREIEKLKELILKDKQIISLKTTIKETAKAQLENGIITSSDFIRELNEEDQSIQNLLLHMIQLSKAEQTYLLTVSN